MRTTVKAAAVAGRITIVPAICAAFYMAGIGTITSASIYSAVRTAIFPAGRITIIFTSRITTGYLTITFTAISAST
jgi:hypothetical protein